MSSYKTEISRELAAGHDAIVLLPLLLAGKIVLFGVYGQFQPLQ